MQQNRHVMNAPQGVAPARPPQGVAPVAPKARPLNPQIAVQAGTLTKLGFYTWLVRFIYSGSISGVSIAFWIVNQSMTIAAAKTVFNVTLFTGFWGWVLALWIVATTTAEIFAQDVFSANTHIEDRLTFFTFAIPDLLSTFIGLMDWICAKVDIRWHVWERGVPVTWGLALIVAGISLFAFGLAFAPERIFRRYVWLFLHNLGFGKIMKAFA